MPDFTKYSDLELSASLARIDQEKFPDNFQAALAEFNLRKSRDPGQKLADRPSKVQYFEDSGYTFLTWRWFRPLALFLPLAAFFFSLPVWMNNPRWKGGGAMGLGGQVVFGFASLVLAIATIYLFVNKTELRIGQGELSIRRFPLPFPGDRVVKTKTIKSLFVKEWFRRIDKYQKPSYFIHAHMNDGSTQVVLGNGIDKDHFLYLATVIGGTLNIPVEPLVIKVQR